jgi:hypothetical protein
MTPRHRFFWGILGGASMEVVRLKILAPTLESTRWTPYLFFSVSYICIAGVVAVLLRPRTPKAAFCTGLATPLFISVLVALGSTPPTKTSPQNPQK